MRGHESVPSIHKVRPQGGYNFVSRYNFRSSRLDSGGLQSYVHTNTNNTHLYVERSQVPSPILSFPEPYLIISPSPIMYQRQIKLGRLQFYWLSLLPYISSKDIISADGSLFINVHYNEWLGFCLFVCLFHCLTGCFFFHL